MKPLQYLLASSVLLILTSCANVGVGGTVSDGSSSGVNIGAGVNIHLYNEPTSENQDDRD